MTVGRFLTRGSSPVGFCREHCKPSRILRTRTTIPALVPGQARSAARPWLDQSIGAAQFVAKYNIRESAKLMRMRNTVTAIVGRNLVYRELVAENGLSKGAGD